MRRRTSVISVLAVLATLTLAPLPAQAADPLTGRLVDAVGSGPVSGQTVRLRVLDGGDPGAVVDTAVTNAQGRFSLDAGPSPEDEYFVQVVPGRFQGGYVGGAPKWVQPNVGYAATYGAHATLGSIRANPAFIRGVIVNATTKKPVRGVKVAARSMNDGWQTEGSDTTNRAGVFTVTGIECEDDCYLKVNGSAQDYEVGYRACNGGVVATWGDACASPIGSIGKVRLDHL
jgi:hypothetical protein